MNGVRDNFLVDSTGSANMISHELAKRCGLHKFPKAEIFKTTDSRGALILQGYKSACANFRITTSIYYEVIPNGIYSDEQGLTTELFTVAGCAVTMTPDCY